MRNIFPATELYTELAIGLEEFLELVGKITIVERGQNKIVFATPMGDHRTIDLEVLLKDIIDDTLDDFFSLFDFTIEKQYHHKVNHRTEQVVLDRFTSRPLLTEVKITDFIDRLLEQVIDPISCRVCNLLEDAGVRHGSYDCLIVRVSHAHFETEYLGDLRIRDYNLRHGLPEWQDAKI